MKLSQLSRFEAARDLLMSHADKYSTSTQNRGPAIFIQPPSVIAMLDLANHFRSKLFSSNGTHITNAFQQQIIGGYWAVNKATLPKQKSGL